MSGTERHGHFYTFSVQFVIMRTERWSTAQNAGTLRNVEAIISYRKFLVEIYPSLFDSLKMAPKATAQQGNATKARGGVSVDQNERLQQAVLGYLASGGFKRAAKAFEAESGTKKGIEHALVSAWASQAVG